MSWYEPGTKEEYERGSRPGMSWWVTYSPLLGCLWRRRGRLVGGILTPCASEAVRCLAEGGVVELVDAPPDRERT